MFSVDGLVCVSFLVMSVVLGAVAGESPFRFVERQEKGTLTVFDGERPVMAYIFGDQLKEGLSPDRTRSSYVHPIYGLDGETLTLDFPAGGHFHHRGLCWAWAQVKVGDTMTDPWDLRRILTKFRRWAQRQCDEGGATLAVDNHWVFDGKRTVATEQISFRVHKATDVGRAIDVTWRIEAKEPLALAGRPKKGYGGFMLRFPQLKDTVLTIDDGTHPANSDLKASAWADLSSRFGKGDAMSGIAIFPHPSHPGLPVGWTLRSYGFINPAWPGPTPFALEPGKPLTLQYRLWVHRGDAAAGAVAQAYKNYVADVKR